MVKYVEMGGVKLTAFIAADLGDLRDAGVPASWVESAMREAARSEARQPFRFALELIRRYEAQYSASERAGIPWEENGQVKLLT